MPLTQLTSLETLKTLPDKHNLTASSGIFSNVRVLIIGDVMLDEYVWGDVNRISPEAPVPIVEIQQKTHVAGGAANVEANIHSLGGSVYLISLVGDDTQAENLRTTLKKMYILTDSLVVDPSRVTTTKTRIIAHSQQIMRLDTEIRTTPKNEIEILLIDQIKQLVNMVDVCVISDYAKGVISKRIASEFIKESLNAGKSILVDPKGNDYTKYEGVSMITPNMAEAQQATGIFSKDETNLLLIGRQLRKIIGGGNVLITRGADGMSLFHADDTDVIHIPTQARNVYDVTGAGDTVLGTLALAIGVGMPIEDAVRLSNKAAGIVVGKIGTSTVTEQELFGI